MTKHSQNISASIMRLALEYIRSPESLRTSFGEYAARHTHYNYNSLQRSFKIDVGVNISTFIVAEKVKMAKIFIQENEDFSLNKISVLCNYKHLSHMTNQFKRMEGITPMQYRTQVRENESLIIKKI